MGITRDTPFVARDDQYHALSDNPLDLETNWWSINIPERRIGIWVHSAFYPNTGKLRWRVFAWDDRGADPAERRPRGCGSERGGARPGVYGERSTQARA